MRREDYGGAGGYTANTGDDSWLAGGDDETDGRDGRAGGHAAQEAAREKEDWEHEVEDMLAVRPFAWHGLTRLGLTG